jgi:hypothetical protein
MVNRKTWNTPALKVIEAGSAENLVTGTANDAGKDSVNKRQS